MLGRLFRDLKIMAGVLLCTASLAAWATIDLVGDDTDLFMTNPAIKSEIPNVLIVLDNTSNWSRQSQQWPALVDATCTAAGITGNQQGDAEVCAIYKAVSSWDERVNVGLMMFQDNNKGGFIRFAVRPMTSANKTSFKTVLASINTNSPNYKTSANSNYENPLNDAFRYFNGFSTRTGAAPDVPASITDADGYTSGAKTVFSPPDKGGGTCGNNFIIFIGNGTPNYSAVTPDITDAAALLNDGSVSVNTQAINATGLLGDVWTRFMYKYGVKITDSSGSSGYRHIVTYAIDVCNAQCQADQQTLLTSMSKGVGGGEYYRATSLAAIETALDNVFKQIQAVNSVFASVTLPVSVNVRGTNANQVYIGVFRPDSKRLPRWSGNLKMYALGCKEYADSTAGAACSKTNSGLELKDQSGTPVVNPLTSFVSTSVSSFWTISSRTGGAGTGFWAFRSPDYAASDVGQDNDWPDGDMVEKGAVAEMIRKFYASPDSTEAMTRKLYTCTGTCTGGDPTSDNPGTLLSGASTDTKFTTDNANITSALLGTLSTVSVTNLSASGTTATATTAQAHGFGAIGSTVSVVVAGAVPSLFNVSGATAVITGANSFTYTLTSAPDSTHAYVTTSGHGLLAGDRVTISGATPSGFNATDAAVTLDATDGANGTKTFYYSPSDVATATGVAAGYSVTGVRSLAAHSGSLKYSSSSGRAAAVLPGHGFSTGNTVVITGAAESGFNCAAGCVIQKETDDSFSYVPLSIPAGGTSATAIATAADHGLATGDTVSIAGASPANYNTATAASITRIDANQFSYTASGTLNSNASGTITASKQWSDTDTWPVTGATVTANGNGQASQTIRLTYTTTGATSLVSSPLHTLAVGNQITVSGITCNQGITCTGTFSVTAVTGTTVSYVATGTTNKTVAAMLSSAKVSWSGAKTSSIAVTAIEPGPVMVNATGTIYVSKSGDLTSKTTAIYNQSTATGTITAALSGAGDPAERENLIRWVRGYDNKDNENKNNISTDIRASVHGDVLHSRPAVINYNRTSIANNVAYSSYPRTLETGNNDVYVFYGTNDGIFHAVRGGYGVDGGKEAWGFIPPEVFGKLKRQRDNNPPISSSQPRDYFLDGSVTVYTRDVNRDNRLVAEDGDKAFLFIGMHRGGRMLYALDVSDPENPRMMWKKGCPNTSNNTGCDDGYEEVGQTWAEPQLGYLRAFDFPVLIFGAGYDSKVEDIQPCLITAVNAGSVTATLGGVVTYNSSGSCTSSGGVATTVNRTMGRGLYIVNALTGEVVWRVGPSLSATLANSKQQVVGEMTYAMPSDPSVINRDRDSSRTTSGLESAVNGYLDRIYIPDTGGNVWRIDVDSATISNWVVTKLASVSGASVTSKRKFLFRPDVVRGTDPSGDFDAVLLGSGDREHPFDATVVNRFYMFKDRKTGLNASDQATITESDLYDVTDDCIQNAAACTSGVTPASAQSALNAKKGWYITLLEGEKTIGFATTRAGGVLFNTHQPKTVSSTQCVSDLGTARDYIVNFANGTAMADRNGDGVLTAADRAVLNAGGGYLPSPVGAIVDIGGTPVTTVLSGPNSITAPGSSLNQRVRLYRYRKSDS